LKRGSRGWIGIDLTPSTRSTTVPSTPPPYVDGHRLLEGRTVVITAAAGTGIGSAVARRCIEEGATILISDAHERRLADAAEELAELAGAPVASAVCNVTVQDEIDRLFSTAVAELGHIDVLINNAGLGGTAELIEMTDDQWNLVLDVTLNGTFRATRAALQHMVPRGSGAIVNNASVLGWRAQAGQAHYAAAKAGVMALTRCAAIEAAPAGIRVNAVAPSLAMHPFLAKVTSDELLDELTSREAFGRAAEPWEVANTMVFLASDYASYLTGEVISVSSQHP
jgi:3-oxoacyl-[acyl-carrier protein] reductase